MSIRRCSARAERALADLSGLNDRVLGCRVVAVVMETCIMTTISPSHEHQHIVPNLGAPPRRPASGRAQERTRPRVEVFVVLRGGDGTLIDVSAPDLDRPPGVARVPALFGGAAQRLRGRSRGARGTRGRGARFPSSRHHEEGELPRPRGGRAANHTTNPHLLQCLSLPLNNFFSAESRGLNDGVPESRHQDASNGTLGVPGFIYFTGPYCPARFGSNGNWLSPYAGPR